MAGPAWHFYYLYAMERAGVLAAVAWMGDRDWYGEGADYLCDVQAQDGGWWGMPLAGVAGLPGGGRPQARRPERMGSVRMSSSTALDTCFALLFLKRGTTPVRNGSALVLMCAACVRAPFCGRPRCGKTPTAPSSP